VSNGRHLFITGPANTASARRFADILSSVVSDLGGPSELTEAERQLARRAASLSVACEKLEESICTGISSAAAAAFTQNTGGLSPYAILAEAGRVLHGVARVRGGADGIRTMAELPPDELDRVTDLLCRAGDLAAKCISAGSEQSADLELLGQLSDRCGRAFLRIGLRRRPREVEDLQSYLARKARELPQKAAEAADVSGGYPGRPPATILAPAGRRGRTAGILAGTKGADPCVRDFRRCSLKQDIQGFKPGMTESKASPRLFSRCSKRVERLRTGSTEELGQTIGISATYRAFTRGVAEMAVPNAQ